MHGSIDKMQSGKRIFVQDLKVHSEQSREKDNFKASDARGTRSNLPAQERIMISEISLLIARNITLYSVGREDKIEAPTYTV